MKKENHFLKWMLKIIFLYAFLTFIGTLVLNAQEREVTGTVTTEEGVTLPGASVLIKGTTTGTITDIDGKYSITVPGTDAVLVFSFVGYAIQEIQVGSQSVIDVVLIATTKKLDEIVVVGYGSQSRTTVSTSVSKVDADDLRSTPVTSNPATALIGKVAGLSVVETDGRPHASPQIWIRGGTDFGPTNDSPLYVIDGVVRDEMDDINPSDIESFSVLKDAASTAIYGARAANGVILITTKRGSAGKSIINFSYDHQFTSIERYKQDFLPYEEEIYYHRISTARSVDPGWLADYWVMLNAATFIGTAGGTGTRTSLQLADDVRAANGGVLPDGYVSITDPIYGKDIAWYPWDWQEQVFRNGNANNYNLDFTGGNDRGTYYTSMNYYTNAGTAPGTSYDRISLITNADYKIADKLKVGANFNYILLDDGMSGWDNDGYRWFERSSRLPSTIRYKDEITGEWVPGNSGKPNPDYWLDHNHIKNIKNKTTLSTFIEWEIIDGLTFRPFASVYKHDLSYGRYQMASAYNGKRQSNGYNENRMKTQLDATLSYKRSIGDDHFVNAMIGTSFINNYEYYVGGSTYGAATDLIYTMNAGALENDNISSSLDQYAIQSWFGRANYVFKNRYMITASMRRDGASLFSEENKWADFPGLSAGWNIHNEDFWTFAPISTLKLRTSWGKTGKIRGIDIFDTQGQYSGVLYAGKVGIQNTQLANTDLVWESTTSYDIGFDMGLLNNRINLLVDYYYKDSHDRLYSKDLPSFTGFSAITTNFGSYINRGVEFEVSVAPVQGTLSWNIAFNWAYNKGTVGELPYNGKDKNRDGGIEIWSEDAGEGYVWVGGYAEGERTDALIGLPNDGIFTTQAEADAYHVKDTYVRVAWPLKMAGDTKWSDRDGNGLVDRFDQIIMGYKLPDHRGGMTNTLSYKGLDFTFAMDWALGHTIWRYEELRIMANSQGEDRTSINVQYQWMYEGDNADFPRTTRGDQNGPGNVQTRGANNASYASPGDYLAFRELALSYRLPMSILDRIPGVNGIQLNVSARNLGWIKNKEVRNPEETDGVDRYMYPVPFTINGGVKLTF